MLGPQPLEGCWCGGANSWEQQTGFKSLVDYFM